MSEHILEVKNLCKYFYLGKNKPPMKAVDDVSFYIEKGETVGLVGESGCGKTTTGRTIIRLYQPTSGEIWFNGKRIDGKLNAEETRQVTSKMQMVFQDPVASLNPRMTVEEIICEGVKINKLYPDKTERRNQVYKMLDMVGLTREHATRYPHEFSGGQRQRICIARALATDPEFVVCDEAGTCSRWSRSRRGPRNPQSGSGSRRRFPRRIPACRSRCRPRSGPCPHWGRRGPSRSRTH